MLFVKDKTEKVIFNCNQENLQPFESPMSQEIYSYTEMTISRNNADKLVASVGQVYSTGATDLADYHGHNINIVLEPKQLCEDAQITDHWDGLYTPTLKSLKKALKNKECRQLIADAVDGHDIVWNGNNMVGEFTQEAEEALQKLRVFLYENLGYQQYVIWSVGDWLCEVVEEWLASYNDPRKIKQRHINKKVREWSKAEEHDGMIILIEGDIEDYIKERLQETIDEIEEEENW